MRWQLKQQSSSTEGCTELYSLKYFSEILLRPETCLIAHGLQVAEDIYKLKVLLILGFSMLL